MRNDYEYIDPDYTYTDPKTGVLRNLGDITDPDDLLFFESTAVIKKAKELETQPIAVHNAETLLDIHRYLFQDIYHWAGQKRTVEISKRPPDNLEKYERYMSGTIEGDVDKLTSLILELLLSI